MVVHRVAAAVTLLFVVSQCAIDDRELEENDGDDDRGGSSNGGTSGSSNGGTGGSSNGGTGGSDLPEACQRDADDDDCWACEKASCCAEYLACLGADECLYFVDCGANCGTDEGCLLSCIAYYPEGATLFTEFTDCGSASCNGC